MGNDAEESPGSRDSPSASDGRLPSSLPSLIQFLDDAVRKIQRRMAVNHQRAGAVVALFHDEAEFLPIGDVPDDQFESFVEVLEHLFFPRLNLLIKLAHLPLIFTHL